MSKEAGISYNEADILKGATEMGDYLGLHRKTIYHMIDNGTLKVTKKGRRLYITKSDLLEQFRVALEREKGGG